jgi:hypothetical protein
MAAEELLNLAARVVFQQLAAPYRAAFQRRFIGVAICGVLAFIAGMAGIICGVLALWLWLRPLVGPAPAALVCAALLLLMALILGLVAASFARRAPPVALGDVLKSKELGAALDKHLPELMIAAAVGGLILGVRRRK